MSKKQIFVILIALSGIIVLAILAGMAWRPAAKESSVLHERAFDQMRTLLLLSESVSLRGFQLTILEERTGTEAWDFIGQEARDFVFTGNRTLPYVVTVVTRFQHPQDQTIVREHAAVFAYHAGRGWLPLTEETNERGEDYVRPVHTDDVWRAKAE